MIPPKDYVTQEERCTYKDASAKACILFALAGAIFGFTACFVWLA